MDFSDMTALQIELTVSSIDLAKEVFGAFWETSKSVPTEKTRDEEMPSGVNNLAS